MYVRESAGNAEFTEAFSRCASDGCLPQTCLERCGIELCGRHRTLKSTVLSKIENLPQFPRVKRGFRPGRDVGGEGGTHTRDIFLQNLGKGKGSSNHAPRSRNTDKGHYTTIHVQDEQQSIHAKTLR